MKKLVEDSPFKQNRIVAIDSLTPHTRNYRVHPDDEIAHLMESIQANGFYRNIVVAKDGTTILAGHGVVEAARKLGIEHIPVYSVEFAADDPRALKLLVSDNEISHLAESDDRALTELLKELKDADLDLLGTGYDDMMLANLLMVTRPASEIADLDAAAQWVGMPEYDLGPGQLQVTVHFLNEEDRIEFFRRLDLDTKTADKKKSLWWPERMLDDSRSIRFTDKDGDADE